MKKVWVNRFNHDGSMKPMNEWELRQCSEKVTHAYPCGGDGWGFDFMQPNRNCFLTEFGTVRESGAFFYEYIGNQRGDGWFYVADGDLPPEDDDDLMVMAWDADGAEKVATIKITTLIYHYNRCLKYGRAFTYPCWQPITSPKFL